MNKLLFAALAAAILLLGAAIVTNRRSAAAAPKLLAGNGRTMTLRVDANALTIVHFWATWCVPCRKELPSLVRFVERTRDKRVKVYAVSEDKSWGEVEQYLKKNGLPLEAYLDPAGKLASQLKADKLPQTFIFTRDGTMIEQFIGAIDWNDRFLEERLVKIAQTTR